jgi:hypothetical protein
VHATIGLTVVEDGQKPDRNLVQCGRTVRDCGIEGQSVTRSHLIGFIAVPIQQFTFKNVGVFGARVPEWGKNLALVSHGRQKGVLSP